MAILYGGYNGDGDEQPEDTEPYELTDEQSQYYELQRTDKQVPKIDQISAAIADYQVDKSGTLPALDFEKVNPPEVDSN